MEPAVEGGIHGVQSASASGLLLLTADGHTLALTFGYGRSFLDQSKIERRFGLKVALNLIDEKQIRSLDTKLFDEMVGMPGQVVVGDKGFAGRGFESFITGDLGAHLIRPDRKDETPGSDASAASGNGSSPCSTR